MSALSEAEPAHFVVTEAVGENPQGIRNSRAVNEVMATLSDAERIPKRGKIILVGSEDETILEKRLRAAGCEVVTVTNGKTAFERVHRESFDGAVLVSRGLLITVTETIFNLRDINPSMEIIVVLDRGSRYSSRFLKQLLSYPIPGTQVLTRRQFQAQLHRQG
jgi:PleD family two-component response regulator